MISGNSDAQRIPAVTIVIPAYNAAQFISDALDSVLAQTFSDYEVIVVNDGSSDRVELEQLLHAHPLPIRYISQENRGVSAARNAAIKVARGEFYAQLDADDRWTRDYLEIQVGILRDNPDVALVYPNATVRVDGLDVDLEFMTTCPSRGEVNFETLVRQQCVVMTCVTARTSAIRDAGMFDESLRSCEDFDLWLRIVKSVGRVVYHRRPLALYRRREGSLSADRLWMLRHQHRVLEKCARTLTLTRREREVLLREIRRAQTLLHLSEGKRALCSRETSTALVHFRAAYAGLHSMKLALVIFFLRLAPGLLIWVAALRDRVLEKGAARFSLEIG